MKINDKVYLPSHFALQISSPEGNIPGPKALSILALIIFFLVLFSKIFFVILFLQDEDTCVSIRIGVVPCDIMKTLNGRSGKLSQIS